MKNWVLGLQHWVKLHVVGASASRLVRAPACLCHAYERLSALEAPGRRCAPDLQYFTSGDEVSAFPTRPLTEPRHPSLLQVLVATPRSHTEQGVQRYAARAVAQQAVLFLLPPCASEDVPQVTPARGGCSLADRSISGPSFRSRHTDALLLVLVLVLVLSLRFLLLLQVPSTGLSLAAAYRRGAVQPATHASVSAAVTFIRFSARLRFKADRNTLL
jgi:hypothetical protein